MPCFIYFNGKMKCLIVTKTFFMDKTSILLIKHVWFTNLSFIWTLKRRANFYSNPIILLRVIVSIDTGQTDRHFRKNRFFLIQGHKTWIFNENFESGFSNFFIWWECKNMFFVMGIIIYFIWMWFFFKIFVITRCIFARVTAETKSNCFL